MNRSAHSALAAGLGLAVMALPCPTAARSPAAGPHPLSGRHRLPAGPPLRLGGEHLYRFGPSLLSGFCSVFDHRPCLPEILYPIGQDLRLTIRASAAQPSDADAANESPDRSSRELNTILDVFSALRACWIPPAQGDARSGMEMTFILSFKRGGETIGEPRVTYTTPNTPSDVRRAYRRSVDDALLRCAPMPFTAGLGGALAGRPFFVRFVDDRPL
jgi:hypothetical protein